MTDIEVMPESIEAEKTILGAVLNESDRLLEIAAILSPDDFSLDSHRRIFAAMLAVTERDSGVDIVTLCQELTNRKEIGTVGGSVYVSDLTSGLPYHPQIENYIKIVKDKALCRALLVLSDGLSARAYSQDESGLEIAAWAVSALSAIAESGQTKQDVFSAEEMADDAEYRLIDNPTDEPAIPTGIQKLDEQTGGGIRLGELWVIGAAPSRGKTTFARQVVKRCVENGIPCYVHSGEMSKESWHDVTLTLIAEMPACKIREPRWKSAEENDRLRAAIKQLRAMPFYVSDAGAISLDRLIWDATREKRIHGIQLLAVDYAQIINAPGRDPREKVTNVAQRLRVFAKEQNVAVLLLSQSPRPEGRNINARPNMYSLKESGALEEAAHTVVLPYRPINEETGVFSGDDELIVAKQRWGSIGTIPVHLNGQMLRFEERQSGRAQE